MDFNLEYTNNIFKSIMIIGCGSLGGTLSYIISKKRLCSHLILVDGDKVEEKNILNQIYDPEDIGLFKVEALKKKLNKYVNITSINFFINRNTLTYFESLKVDVVIDTTDNLDTLRSFVPHLKSKLKGFIKIRDKNAMFGMFCDISFNRLIHYLENKKESQLSASLPTPLESSLFSCALFAYFISNLKMEKYDKLYFVDFKNMNIIIDFIDL